jgi:hypothetical protein
LSVVSFPLESGGAAHDGVVVVDPHGSGEVQHVAPSGSYVVVVPVVTVAPPDVDVPTVVEVN